MSLLKKSVKHIEPEKENKNIYILLTDYPDRVSRFLKRIGLWRFSHVSVSTGTYNNSFFSFVGKRGFRIEQPVKHPRYKGIDVPCVLYRVPVDSEKYELINKCLRSYIERGHRCKYNYFGLVLMYFGIHKKMSEKNTCSGFVSDVLRDSGIISEKQHKTLVKPDDYLREFRHNIIFSGSLANMIKKLPQPAT